MSQRIQLKSEGSFQHTGAGKKTASRRQDDFQGARIFSQSEKLKDTDTLNNKGNIHHGSY